MKNLLASVGVIALLIMGCSYTTSKLESNEEPMGDSKYDGVYYEVITDGLGCMWFVVKGMSSGSGVATQHHPQCDNPQHKVQHVYDHSNNQ